MKFSRLTLIAALSPVLVLAAASRQTPPPPDAADASGSPATHSSRVNAVIYGPQGEVQALTLRNGVAVTLTPDIGTRLTSSVTKGTRVRVSGIERVIAGQTSLAAQSLTANGQTFVADSAPLRWETEIAGAATASADSCTPVGTSGPRGDVVRVRPRLRRPTGPVLLRRNRRAPVRLHLPLPLRCRGVAP